MYISQMHFPIREMSHFLVFPYGVLDGSQELSRRAELVKSETLSHRATWRLFFRLLALDILYFKIFCISSLLLEAEKLRTDP